MYLPGPLELVVPVSEWTWKTVEEHVVFLVRGCYHCNLRLDEPEHCLHTTLKWSFFKSRIVLILGEKIDLPL